MKRGVVVVGAAGRLGSYACHLLESSEEFEVAARVGRQDDLAEVAARHEGCLGLELTIAGSGARNATTLLESGLPTVVGTSGVTADEVRDLDDLACANGIGVLILPNFSRGAALLSEFALRAAQLFPHVELVETHRLGKLDAPSGTARRLAAELAEQLGTSIPIHSLRLPGAGAIHELQFAGPGERVTLRHEARGLEAYGEGILTALRAVQSRVGATVGWTALEA